MKAGIAWKHLSDLEQLQAYIPEFVRAYHAEIPSTGTIPLLPIWDAVCIWRDAVCIWRDAVCIWRKSIKTLRLLHVYCRSRNHLLQLPID